MLVKSIKKEQQGTLSPFIFNAIMGPYWNHWNG